MVSAGPAVQQLDLGFLSGSDADGASTDYWTYTISAAGKVSGSESSYTAIGPGYAADRGSYVSTNNTNVGSWGFDENGYGPFGCFYAAFDPSSNNRMICHLDPDDLTKSNDGKTDISGEGYNIMWCLPTIYWGTDASGNLVLSNDPSKGTAYAHTVDGTVWPYLAIGVYEASSKTINQKTILTSESGVTPLTNKTREQFRDYAMNQSVNTDGKNQGEAMLWNFYQYQLYKYCAVAVMGSWDSQAVAGNGHCKSSVAIQDTGSQLDEAGPYAGCIGDGDQYATSHVKVFIENAWGSRADLIDGIIIDQTNIYVSQMSDPGDDTNVVSGTQPDGYEKIGTMAGTGWNTAISADKKTWGFQTQISTSAFCDYTYRGTSGPYKVSVGGYNGTTTTYNGIAQIAADITLTKSNLTTGTRLAFIFETDPYSEIQIDPGHWYYFIGTDGSVSGRGRVMPDLTAIGPGYASNGGKYTSNTGSNVGSWSFDSDGYGPFGSFYAAFDASKSNKFLCILDPNDLNYSITGKPLSYYGTEAKNIMWCLPTVYWLTSPDGTLIVTDDPDCGGTAYAHTVDGVKRNYLAIGVYEAYSDGSKLLSQSGQNPTVSQTRDAFRTLALANAVSTIEGDADKTNGQAMLWNFYQWELYKYCAIAVMGSWDSQSVAGNGHVYMDGSSTWGTATGQLDSSGPYAGTIGQMETANGTDPVKVFIENSWGSVYEIVDGIIFDSKQYYISQKSNPGDTGSTASGSLPDGYSSIGQSLPDGKEGWGAEPSTDVRIWGMPTAFAAYESSIFRDKLWAWDNLQIATVGGCSSNDSVAGISTFATDIALGGSSASRGARIAFVFDSIPASESASEVTSIIGGDTEKQTVSVRLEIPSTSASGMGTLTLRGVYWIETSDGIRAYGDISTLGIASQEVQEQGSGMIRYSAAFEMKDADHRVYSVYAEYESADGSYTVRSPTVFSGDPPLVPAAEETTGTRSPAGAS